MIKIIADSASDLVPKEAENLGITILPMEIIFGEEQFYDGVNLSHEEFFEKLISSNIFPKTSQINEFRFTEAFEQALQNEDDRVLCITMSSKLSGTYNSAVMAAKKFDGKVKVVDSLNAAMGEKILVQYAVQLVNAGLGFDEVEKKVSEKKNKIEIYAVVGTLEYLKKGGRISSFVAFAGTLLNIKPLVAIIDGEVKLVGKAKGAKNGYKLLNSMVEKCGGIDYDMPFTTAYTGLDDSILQQYLEDNSNLWKGKTDIVPQYLIGSTIGTHVGPSCVGVAFFSKN